MTPRQTSDAPPLAQWQIWEKDGVKYLTRKWLAAYGIWRVLRSSGDTYSGDLFVEPSFFDNATFVKDCGAPAFQGDIS